MRAYQIDYYRSTTLKRVKTITAVGNKKRITYTTKLTKATKGK